VLASVCPAVSRGHPSACRSGVPASLFLHARGRVPTSRTHACDTEASDHDWTSDKGQRSRVPSCLGSGAIYLSKLKPLSCQGLLVLCPQGAGDSGEGFFPTHGVAVARLGVVSPTGVSGPHRDQVQPPTLPSKPLHTRPGPVRGLCHCNRCPKDSQLMERKGLI
jgi:hypothetical protein